MSPPEPNPNTRVGAHARTRTHTHEAASSVRDRPVGHAVQNDGRGSREPGKPKECQRDVLDGARSPRLVLVREPDQLGVERAHPQLAFGVRLIELAEPNRHVAARQPDTRQSR
jgi:hypothetical protein